MRKLSRLFIAIRKKLIARYFESLNNNKILQRYFWYLLVVVFEQVRWIIEFQILVPYRRNYLRLNFINGHRFMVPELWEANHGALRHVQKMKDIYLLKDFVEIAKGDIVVDIGAYLGTFSIIASKKASIVFAVDPFAFINNCLAYNVKKYSNIKVVPNAIWNKNEKLDLNLSRTPNDNSVLEPDSNSSKKSVVVSGITLQQLAINNKLKYIDFLKVEAEGAEPEVLQAIGDLPIGKISVNCGPERYGKTPTEEVVKILKSLKFEVQVVKNPHWAGEMVFAKKDILQ